ncbi:MAG: hypothetical protein ACXVQR_02370 [Solirubrobacteraceae bacterium]
MPGSTTAEAPIRGRITVEEHRASPGIVPRSPIVRHPWWCAGAAIVALSIGLVIAFGIRPAYDPYGWLVWGHQTLHWNLNTDGEPSWKPLTYLFTLPYALAGRAQLWLWMVTAVSVSMSGPVFAGRVAYKLTGVSGAHRHAAFAAGLFAGVGLLGIRGYADYIFTAKSDPMIVALCLAAVDFHLSRRPRVAFLLLVLAAVGRPEVWPVVALYALWAWRAMPPMRTLVAAGTAVILPAWFLIPALTSDSWFGAGDLALQSAPEAHGSRVLLVLTRFQHLYALPMELAALAAIVMAIRGRDRAPLVLAGAAALWVAVEIGFALHGWSGAARYMFEPAAIVVVLAGTAVGWLLVSSGRASGPARWAGPALVLALVVALLPSARVRLTAEHANLVYERRITRQIDRLHSVIVKRGARRILACGQPVVSALGFQSVLAWEIGVNVASVSYEPGRSISSGEPIVLFEPHGLGWNVRPVHIPAAQRRACEGLRTSTPFR